jgi:hypothetical protein
MKKYVFYNNTTGDIKFIKKFTPENAQQNVSANISYVLEETLGYVFNKDKVKIDLDTMTLVAVTQPTIDPWISIKEKRNNLLISSDWTQAVDSPLSDSKKTEWQTYRQALRDLPAGHQDTDNIDEVAFPNLPQ